MNSSQLSIVVPTLNRPHEVAELLRALAGLPDVGLVREVVLVDQSDEPHEIRDQQALPFSVVHLRRRYRNVSRARNDGAEVASTDTILFVDDDCRPQPGCIAAHLQALTDGGASATTGPYVAPGTPLLAVSDSTPDALASLASNTMARFDVDFAYGPTWAAAGNLGCKRSAFLAVQGFDERLDRFNEDAELSYRLRKAGYLLRYEPAAVMQHLTAQTGGNRAFTTNVQVMRKQIANSLYYLSRLGLSRSTALSALWRLYRVHAFNRATLIDRSVLGRSRAFARATLDAVLHRD